MGLTWCFDGGGVVQEAFKFGLDCLNLLLRSKTVVIFAFLVVWAFAIQAELQAIDFAIEIWEEVFSGDPAELTHALDAGEVCLFHCLAKECLHLLVKSLP